MIKLLADENFPLASVELLEINKYDVLSVSKTYSGKSDRDIIHLPAHVVMDLLQNNTFETVGTITVIEDNFIRQKKF